MQATHYRTDEEDGAKRSSPIKGSTLGNDNAFAEFALNEQQPLMGPEKLWYNLLRQTRDKWWLSFGWSLEILLLLYVLMAMSMEVWGACPHEMGLAPVCQYCYSTQFLVWNGILVGLWFLDLYLFVLLVSRGFVFTVKGFGNVFPENESKGIPTNAIATFLYLTVTLVAWLIVGIFLLILSQSCNKKSTSIYAASSPGRSGLMMSTTILCVLAAPFLLFVGRRIGPGPYTWFPENVYNAIPIPTVDMSVDI